jgi:hypothetical protein
MSDNNNNKSKGVERHKTNPFLKDLKLEYVKKPVRVSVLGQDENILLNPNTGESQGTHLMSYRKVDKATFVKLFCQNIALTFGLSAAGFKTLMVVSALLQRKGIGRDQISLDSYAYEEFLEEHKDSKPKITNFSIATFQRGLTELVSAKIIARCLKKGDFFINPSFVFNGNRVVFSTVLDLDEKQKEKEIVKDDEAVPASEDYKLEQEVDTARTARQKERPAERNFLNDSLGDL